MQVFGGLRPTGLVDADTLALLKAPRCGNGDGEGRKARRKRLEKLFKSFCLKLSSRYVIGSKGWKKRTLTYK